MKRRKSLSKSLLRREAAWKREGKRINGLIGSPEEGGEKVGGREVEGGGESEGGRESEGEKGLSLCLPQDATDSVRASET